MSFKRIFSSTRGEAASLVLIVSMIVATLGIITGSRVVEQRIKTTSKAQTPLSCSIILPGGQMQTGKSYTLSSTVQNGSGSYTYNWRVVQASNQNTDYGATGPTTNSSVLWSAPNDLSLGTLGTARLNIVDIANGQTATCQTILQITTPPAPLSCSVTVSNIPQTAGQTYTFNAAVQNGSGTYQYIWKTVQGANNTISYGSLAQSNTHTPTNQWTAPTNASLGTIGIVRLDVFDYGKATTAVCQTALQVNFPVPTATNTPVPPTLTNTPVPKVFTLNGSVKYANGVGTQDVVIKLFNTYSGSLVTQTTTNANGQYTFADIPEGTYDIKPQSTASTTISPVMHTVPLIASPYTVTAPLFTASGSPPNTSTPIPPPATNTPTNTPMPTTPPVVTRPDVVIKSATHSFNTLGGMTVNTVFENIGTAAVNYVGAHAMNVEVKDGSQVVCETTNLAGIAGLAPQTTKSHTTYFPTNIYSSCPSFTPTPGKTYKVTLYVDPPGSSNTGMITELDETNNTKSFDFTQPAIPTVPVTVPAATNTPTAIPQPLPDLIVKSATHTFDTSANLTMVAGIQNVGKAKVNSGNHVLNIEIKDPVTSPTTVLCETISAVDISGLAPQAIYSHTVLFTSEIYSKCPKFSPIPGKTYKVTLYIDPPTKTNKNGTVPEAIETNNSRSFNFVQPGGAPPTNTPVPPAATNTPTAQPTSPFATSTPMPPSATNVDVNMNVTIINPQANFTIWGTAQELTGSQNVTPTPVKCNTGDSTQAQTIVKCPQLKRGKNYEFVALAKEGKPNAQTIQSTKNTYIIPGSPNVNPQIQNKTLTLPPVAATATQIPTVPPTTNTPVPGSKADMIITEARVSFTATNSMNAIVTFKNDGNAPAKANGVDSIGISILQGSNEVCKGSVIGGFGDMPVGKIEERTIAVTTMVLNNCTTFTPVVGTAYKLTVKADSDNKISESNENNNSFSVDFVFGQNPTTTPPANALPDLKVMSTTHSPYLTAVTFDSAVKNIGTRDVNLGGSIHDVYYELKQANEVKCKTTLARNQVDGMNPEATVQIRATIDPANSEWQCPIGFTFQNGTAYSLVITLDVFKRINELDESNVFTYDFTYNSSDPAATSTPVPPPNSTPTPTPLRPLCTDLQVTGDTATKYDVIFLPSGYTDYNVFEADAREAMAYYKSAVPDAGLQGKYNFKAYTDITGGYDVTTCNKGTLLYPCWSSYRAKDTMRNCNGDAYVVMVYTPKPSEDAVKANEALAKFGNVKGQSLGKNKGEYLVLRYDISILRNLVAGALDDGSNTSFGAALIQAFQNLLQRFR